jgi:metal-sulfur cluster biosynthetic enzyme
VSYSRTSMGSPAGQQIQEQIHDVAASIEGVENVSTELTFTPPWTPEMMSDDAKFVLGF